MAESSVSSLQALGVWPVSQYGQTELGGMAMIGSPQGPTGAMRPVPGIHARLEYDERAAGGVWDEMRSEERRNEPGMSVASGELVLCGVRSLTAGYLRLDVSAGVGPMTEGIAGITQRSDACCIAGGGVSKGFDASLEALDTAGAREWATGDIFQLVGDEATGYKATNGSSSGWFRHVCRQDEILVLSSGELADPTAFERALLEGIARRQATALESGGSNAASCHAWTVGGCIVFGSSRACPAAIVEISPPKLTATFADDDELVRGAKANIDTTTAWLDDAWAAAYEALDDANQTVPSYAIVPPSLLKFHVVGQPCPLGEKSALRRTAKVRSRGIYPVHRPYSSAGTSPMLLTRFIHVRAQKPQGGIVRRDVERRFGSWLDQTLAAAANMRARIGQGDDSNATGTRRSILGGVESVCPSSAAQGASGAAEALDSLGLTALAFKRNSSSRMASAHSRAGEFPLSLDPFDALLQHVKVAFC